MSFLLDALRKSESQKQLGSTPTIHSASEFEAGRPANRRLGLLSLVLLPALLVLAWFGLSDAPPWRPDLKPGGEEQPLARSTIPPVSTTGSSVRDDPATDGNNVRLAAERTPVEIFQEPAATPGRQRPELVTQALKPGSGIPDQGAAVSSQPVSVSKISLADPSLVNSDQSAGAPVATNPTDEPPSQEAPGLGLDPLERAPIEYWQLPESIRTELGILRITVMVYSDKPGERFILLNGKRVVEGDEPQQGLVLEAIRREGAVFSYRLYKFLLAR